MHMEYVSDELEIVLETMISSKSTQGKSQLTTKKDDAKMQRFELSPNDRSSYSLESPP
jgi:hypothetical protein